MSLIVDGISRRFGGITALESVSFALTPELISCLIGPNGSGKTTLFNIVTGVLRANEGGVRLGEVRLERLKPHKIVRLGVARTFQTTRLFPSLTVLQNVLLAAQSLAEKTATRRSSFSTWSICRISNPGPPKPSASVSSGLWSLPAR